VPTFTSKPIITSRPTCIPTIYPTPTVDPTFTTTVDFTITHPDVQSSTVADSPLTGIDYPAFIVIIITIGVVGILLILCVIYRNLPTSHDYEDIYLRPENRADKKKGKLAEVELSI
jgi:hypothetical protein